MTKGFSLIEVLVSVLLLIVIGFTLTKISSQNINTMQSAQNSKLYLHSFALQSEHEFKDINDYVNISNIPKENLLISKEEAPIGINSLPLTEEFILMYETKKTIIKSENGQRAYLRIQ